MSDNFHKGAIKEERQIYEYDDSADENDSGSEDSRDGKESEHRSKKKYSVIPQSVREKFIKRVLSKEVTIKEAAKEFGLKFSTSKAILQTYKKEGRIGKKKNRERKTKVVNVVFVCNINPINPYASNIFPIVSVNEIKGSKSTTNVEENKNKLVEQTLNNYPEHKIVHQTNLQIPNDSNKSTQQFIKELGNDFLKDFIEKNFNPGKISSTNSMSNTYNMSNPTSNPSSTQGTASMGSSSNMMNLNNFGNMPPPHLNNTMNNLGAPTYAMSQQYNIQGDLPQNVGMSHYGQFNQSSNPMNPNMQINQKRSFQSYERDTIPELDPKTEQITDMSVKKFKSGEDALWDFDMDRSKKDLEDFIYKTHNAIKNNTYINKAGTFDFSRYKDDFNE